MSHPVPRSFLSALLILAVAASAARAATVYVANDGVDGDACGSKKSPCRSIGQAVNGRAADGDSVVVGPGVYGDLNGNGTAGDSAGEEVAGFGCMLPLLVHKVALTSSSGAATTIIDGRFDDLSCTVGIGVDGTQFGQPGKGFTVTNTASATGSGIVINASNVQVRGNQVIATGMGSNTFGLVGGPGTFLGSGIETADQDQTMVIEGNQVIGWAVGILAYNAGKTIRDNALALNSNGIAEVTGGAVAGNVVVANVKGISLGLATNTVGNAVYGNFFSGLDVIATPYTGKLQKNDFVANGFPGLSGSPNCGMTAPVDIAAPNNYWGSATGPGADPADLACSGGTITTAPFATKPFKVKTRIKP